MPDGLVTWVDPSVGKAGIVRGGRSYVARLAAVETGARQVGAVVHFEIRREDGVETATDVRLRGGRRTGPHHRNVGTLVGAHDPTAEAPEQFARTRPEEARGGSLHPLQVVGTWGQLIAAGALDDVVALYRADAELHLGGVTMRGHRHIRGYLEKLPAYGAGRRPRVRATGDAILARFEPAGKPGSALEIRTRVEHGLIAEQWVAEAEAPAEERETASGPVLFETVTHGDVPAGAVDYALKRVQAVVEKTAAPVLVARVKLSMAADPARSRPAMAETSLNVNGQFIGARVAAHEMFEAVDLLQRRLADQMEHRAERIEALRRHSPGESGPGQWRHADLPATRPEYFDRRVEDRQLVRHKVFFPKPQSLDEAVFDADQLDYDFYLYRDLDSGEDSVLERRAGGTYRLQRLHPGDRGQLPSFATVEVDERPAGVLTLEEAVEQLSETDARFVFFADVTTGRGCVLYRRYDGHYGLITLD